ncbi:MAG: Gfo/Idh/MocA family protein [Spirochaetota bacterium]
MKNIALIGCGRIAFLLEGDPLRNKPCTHYGGIRAAGMNVSFACDIDRARLDRFGKKARLRSDALFTDSSELFASTRPDIAVIATWTPSHSALGIAAAEAGSRVIVCEKPIAASLRDARKLCDACSSNGSILVINHERRYDGRYRTAKKIAESGRIGELRSVRAFLPTGPFRGAPLAEIGGGSLLHDGTHLLDMVRFFAGDIATAQGLTLRYGRTRGFEDHAAALLETESGIPVFIETGGAVHYFGFGLEIRGTDGMIEIGNGYQRLFKAKKSRLYKGFRDLKEVPFPRIPATNCFTELYREADKISKGKLAPCSAGRDGYKALEAIHGIYYAAFTKRLITFPVNERKINIKKIFAL